VATASGVSDGVLDALARALQLDDAERAHLFDLVGELSTRSDEFRTWWAAHNVRYHQTGTKRLRHPVVGELELEYEVMDVSADDGLTISVYSAGPGQPLAGGT